MARHHSPEERIKLLAAIVSQDLDKVARARFYTKHEMSEMTYYAWKRQYMKTAEERALVLQAVDADTRRCRELLKSLARLRNPPAPEPFMGFVSKQEFLAKHQTHPADEDGYWMPERNLDAEGQSIWAEWEAQCYVEHVRDFGEHWNRHEKKLLANEKKLQLLKTQQPPVRTVTDHWSFGLPRVRVHGRMPRGPHTGLTLNLPADLHWRLTQEVDGNMSQCIIGLLRHTLEQLDGKSQMLHVYDERNGAPAVFKPALVEE